ncbi:hypothetical protein ElyMa_005913200 [Elysia marginata]|uniref:Uncharacterized protein n=1 Tax=Elysia marginata TaxID=1093978 RepID=A0AAV4G8U9_9GAST|nr:hypothetical protein ElyMa_005913200 [Elysia marginata]
MERQSKRVVGALFLPRRSVESQRSSRNRRINRVKNRARGPEDAHSGGASVRQAVGIVSQARRYLGEGGGGTCYLTTALHPGTA